MDYSMQFLLFLTTSGLAIILVEATDVQVIGIVGESVHLPCNVSVALEDPDVTWVDLVWGTEENPEKIFESRHNPSFRVKESHSNRNNFRVDENFGLTISRLDLDSDVGRYTCRSRVDGSVHRKHYYVTIAELPACSGETHVRAGDDVTLACEMPYSGRQPSIEWYEDEHLVDSIDEFEIRLARKVVKVHATSRLDDAKFRCRMSLGDTVKECSLTLNITFAVHEPKFHPHKEEFTTSEELKCVAKGNPSPTMTLTPSIAPVTTGHGWIAFIVDESWEGQNKVVECTASNLIDGVEHIKSTNLSFRVSAPKRHPHPHTTITIPEQVNENNPGTQDQESVDHHHRPEEEEKPVSYETSEAAKPDVKLIRSDNSAAVSLPVLSQATIWLLSVATAAWI